MKLEYNSNNSGGDWWLNDQDWLNMEKAGWKVNWVKDNKPTFGNPSSNRWLGALATSASIETDDIAKTVKEWEELTNQNAVDEGCNCCGQPHSFSWEDDEGHAHWLEIHKETSWST